MTVTGYRSPLPKGRDGFVQLLRAEWTKLRSVPGWIIGMAVMALTIVGLGVFMASSSVTSCGSADGKDIACPAPPLGPEGDAVEDKLFYVNQPLTGDGSITVRITKMSGVITYPPPDHDKIVSGMVPWAKTGIMIKENTKQGSAYAAMMTTAEHGVRMQHDYKYDTAGKAGKPSSRSPRWLRLDRSGDTITGYESTDGERWSKVESVRLADLPKTVRVGMFTASPGSLSHGRSELGGYSAQMRLATATGVFDNVTAPSDDWKSSDIGVTNTPDGGQHHPGQVKESHGTFTITGNGDIAPKTDGRTAESTLVGVLIGLIAVIVVAVLFASGEYRRGLIRTTVLTSPRRGRVLLAKASVIGASTFAVGLAAIVVTVPLGKAILRGNGNHILPVSTFTEIRVLVGTAVLLALVAVLGLALGSVFRRGLPAALTVSTMVILPFLLSSLSVLPQSIAQWLLRLTPAAGFAIQQSIPEYSHVLGDYVPVTGYYPLSPWAGLAVAAAFAAGALWLAVNRLNRRDL